MSHLSLLPHEVTKVVSHAPCPDGYAAALVAYSYNPKLEFDMVTHEELVTLGPRVAGHKVLFVDIAPTCTTLEDWKRQGHVMCDYAILDHHASAEAELKSVTDDKKVFRMDISGCVLSWHYFYGTSPVPLLFQAVQARDLFKKEMVKDCDALLAGLHCDAGYCAACWAQCTFRMDHLLQLGKALDRNRWRNIGNYVFNARPRVLLGVRAWVVNCTDPACVSDTGATLVSKDGCSQDIAVIFRYNMDQQTYSVSLRSLTDVGPDVSAVARQFGGGGHKHAAAFMFKGRSMEDLFST